MREEVGVSIQEIPLKSYSIKIISSRVAEDVECNDQDKLTATIPITLT